ncbi:unnamed protein product [Brassica oleracea var. botrytis]
MFFWSVQKFTFLLAIHVKESERPWSLECPPPVAPGTMSSSTDHLVATFWDWNTCSCPIESEASARTLISNIESGLGQVPHGHEYRICRNNRFLCGDITAIERSLLVDQRFDCYYAPRRNPFCGEHAHLLPDQKRLAAELGLESLLVHYADVHRDSGPWNILLITGDSSFATSMDYLYYSGYTIFLAKPSDAADSFEQHSNYAWDWTPLHTSAATQPIHVHPPSP